MMSTICLKAMLLRSCVIVGLGISLSGCFGGCAGWKPINPSKDDKLTDGTTKQILAHDEYGVALKCPAFKPKGGFF